jgi:hypothetical protein
LGDSLKTVFFMSSPRAFRASRAQTAVLVPNACPLSAGQCKKRA